MTRDPVRALADALLYEGYLLWPYRRSAIKNRKRWTFGGIYPEGHGKAEGGGDPSRMVTECLVEGIDEARLEVRLRFLHLVQRSLRRGESSEPVDELEVGTGRYLAFQEATEREIAAAELRLGDLTAPVRIPVEIAAGSELETLRLPGGEIGGSIVRSWRSLRGNLEISSRRLEERLFRLRVEVRNTTPWSGSGREEALESTFIASHTVLEVDRGGFVSLLEPPAHLEEQAKTCGNEHTWPVLVGEEGDRRRMLSSPIILYDYPRIAPESPADLFDSSEIDELLTLSILALTDEEKREMSATDPRARRLLERASSLTPVELRRLHGAFRGGRE